MNFVKYLQVSIMKLCTIIFTILLYCNSFGSTISFPDTSTAINSQIQIPLYTTELSGLDVLSFDFTVDFDSSLIEFVRFEKFNTLSNIFTLVSNSNVRGQLKISAAGVTSISGKGVLVYLIFQTKELIGRADLEISEFTFSDNVTLSERNPERINGRLTIMSDINNNIPELSSIEDISIVLGHTFSIIVTANDSDNDTLNFSLLSAPEKMTIDGVNGNISWTPTEADTGIHIVKVEVEDKRGGFDEEIFIITVLKEVITSINDNMLTLPTDFKLMNYPNPFNPETYISYTLQKSGMVFINIYDITGKLVKILVKQNHHSGNFTIKWDGTNSFGIRVSSGIYFYQLRSDNVKIVKKMQLIK